MSKRQKRGKKISIEEIYRNKNFVPPKEKNLETIFEVPRESKDGGQILTSVKKYRRYLHFDPTQGKIQKRKVKANKCIRKLLSKSRSMRSDPEISKCEDIMYKLEALGDSSNDSDVSLAQDSFKQKDNENNKSSNFTEHCSDVEPCSSTVNESNLIDTAKNSPSMGMDSKHKFYSQATSDTDQNFADIEFSDTKVSQESDNVNNDEKEHGSPRRSCSIS